MNGKDARISPRILSRWQAWLAALVGVAAVAAVVFAFRGSFGPQAASAQAPAVRPAAPTQARPAFGSPTARPASPATVAAPKGTRPAGSPAAPGASTQQVMAVVNGEQISRTDLGRECIRRYGQEVLESMVNRQLIAAACAERKIVITEEDVNVEIDRIAARFSLPRDRWMQLLEEERGYSERQYKSEVVWPMLALRQL
ncbi:MAG TPA: peptidylprolyl isomerase, partial [Pirellulaceae bacterium]|nr:peptidylprolyl isomerase [Pirellulaceae bacterium]